MNHLSNILPCRRFLLQILPIHPAIPAHKRAYSWEHLSRIWKGNCRKSPRRLPGAMPRWT
ncbi:MAG: hypothetical protein E7234_00970 [Lachnospiraceae bacterium]|nr:hypothetical protein [Lachnospiraceae bacterium]